MALARFMLVSRLAQALLLSAAPRILFAQPAVPVRDLSAPTATASATFRNIFSVREIGGRKVLVNDGVRRQVVMLDASLSNPIVMLDSISEGGNAYAECARSPLPHSTRQRTDWHGCTRP